MYVQRADCIHWMKSSMTFYIRIEKKLEKIIKLDSKGTFHAKMGTINERNGMDLIEEEILRIGGKNTQNCTEKIFTTQIIMMV